EFLELFKVAADFDEDIDKNKENCLLFAHLINNLATKDCLKPLTKDAVAEVMDQASRLIGDSSKMSTHVRALADLLRESNYVASIKEKEIIDRDDVEEAITQQIYRASRLRDRTYELIHRGTILIDTFEKRSGQINALTVVMGGGFAFGYPVRITARVGIGRGQVIDIEREVKL